MSTKSTRRISAVMGTAMLGLTIAAVTAPSANAVTGRRVCLYASDIEADNVRETANLVGGGFTNPTVKRYVGVNYTKNRACPKIPTGDPGEHFQSLYGGSPLADVKQIKCEDFLGEIHATGTRHEAIGDFNLQPGEKDVCKAMTKDVFYEFDIFKDDPDIVPKAGDFTVESGQTLSQMMDWGY